MAQEALLGWVEACVSPNLCPESLQDLQDGKALATILLDVYVCECVALRSGQAEAEIREAIRSSLNALNMTPPWTRSGA